MTVEVPNRAPDIPTAIATLANGDNQDADNYVWLTQSPLYTSQTILISNAFSPGKRLTICPKPGVLTRAAIIKQDVNAQILFVSGAGGVTLQALDLLKDITPRPTLRQSRPARIASSSAAVSVTRMPAWAQRT